MTSWIVPHWVQHEFKVVSIHFPDEWVPLLEPILHGTFCFTIEKVSSSWCEMGATKSSPNQEEVGNIALVHRWSSKNQFEVAKAHTHKSLVEQAYICDQSLLAHRIQGWQSYCSISLLHRGGQYGGIHENVYRDFLPTSEDYKLGRVRSKCYGRFAKGWGSYTEHVYEMCVQPKLKKVSKERCVNVQFDNIWGKQNAQIWMRLEFRKELIKK